MCEPFSQSYRASMFETGTPRDNNRDCVVYEACVTSHPFLVSFPFYTIPICLLFKIRRLLLL